MTVSRCPSMTRRRWLARLAGFGLLAVPTLEAARSQPAGPASAAAGTPLRGGENQGAFVLGERLPTPATSTAAMPDKTADTDWDSLIPPDWDALREFEQLDFSTMSDSDPRAMAALRKLQQSWKKAPANPAMDDRDIAIAGFIVPLDNGRGPLREFLLVPYFGACIHVPPPPANQVIHVLPDKPVDGLHSMDAVRVQGRLRIQRLDTALGSSTWLLNARSVVAYTGS